MQWTYSRKFNDLFKEHFNYNFEGFLDPEGTFDDAVRNVVNYNKLLDLIDSTYTSNSDTYRGKYEFLTGTLVPYGFQVHHIDVDRSNNHISNLVALPNKLHHKYHHSLIRMKELSTPCNQVKDYIMPVDLYDTGGSEVANFMRLEDIREFIELQQEGCFWVGYRNALLGVNMGCPAVNYQKHL